MNYAHHHIFAAANKQHFCSGLAGVGRNYTPRSSLAHMSLPTTV